MKGVFVILCVVSLLLVGCGGREPSAALILEELRACCAPLPCGQPYFSGAEEGMDTYLNPSLAEALYGERGARLLWEVEEFALFLSLRPAPLELAVFRCFSREDADRMAAVCMERADVLRVALRSTAFAERAEWIRVWIKGRTVVMTVAPDPETLKGVALRHMR